MASQETIKQHLAQSSNINLDIMPTLKGDEVRKMGVMEHIQKSLSKKG